MKPHILYILGLIFTLFFYLNCGDNATGPEEIDYSAITDIQYAKHVQHLFDQQCTSCHAGANAAAGLSLDSWDHVIQGSDFGEALIPFDAEKSLMIEMLNKLVGGPHPVEQGGEAVEKDAIDFLARWINEGAKNETGQVPYANATRLLYVCDQDAATVSIIDVDAKLVIRTVKLQDLGFSLTSKPHHIAIEPKPRGEYWYLSLIGDNKVLKFDRSNQLMGQTTIETPALLGAHPDNGLLYVSRFPQVGGQTPQLIGVIDRESMEPRDDIPVRPVPHAMAVDHAGNFVYTCSLSESEIVIINPKTNETDEFLQLGSQKGPIQVAVSPDDQTLYVSNQISNEMIVVDVSDPSSRAITDVIPVNAQPWHPTFTPDGDRVYVGNLGANTVSVINTASKDVAVIGDGSGQDGISQPHGIAVTSDGQFVFVSSRNASGAYTPRHDFGDNDLIGTVVVINTNDNSIERVIEVAEFASGLAISEP